MNAPTILYLVGSSAIFLAERMFGGNDAVRWALLGLGGLLALLAVGGRLSTFERHPVATKLGVLFYAISMSAALFYVLQLKDVVDLFGFADDTAKELRVALQAAIPLAWLVGALPAFGINRTLAASPHSVHPLRVAAAWEGGLAVALGLGMLFPLNYLAHEHNERFDFGFFKTTKVGDATRKIVDSLTEPVRVVLFFPPSSDVLSELRPYFDDLENDDLSVEVMDHAMAPDTAKEWKVRDNGNIALVMGEKVEIIKLADKLDSAKKDLRKLDGKVQTSLLKLTKEKRTVYFTVGHNEFFWKNAASDEENIDTMKKALEGLNLKVKELGMKDGLAQAVPDDAAIVFVVGPRKPFFPEEIAALKAYRDQGGSLFMMLEPTDDVDPALYALGGVEYTAIPMLSDKAYIRVTGGLSDRAYIGTNKYSSHESVTSLSKNSQDLVLITPGAGSVKEAAAHEGKVTVTVKGSSEWFHDANGNYEFDKDAEKRSGLDLGVVASGPAAGGDKDEWRVAVLGDAPVASNMVLDPSPPTQVYRGETKGWLTADPAIGGETESEEDVKIQHTKEGEALWFYGITAGFPALVFTVGALRVARRRKKGAA